MTLIKPRVLFEQLGYVYRLFLPLADHKNIYNRLKKVIPGCRLFHSDTYVHNAYVCQIQKKWRSPRLRMKIFS